MAAPSHPAAVAASLTLGEIARIRALTDGERETLAKAEGWAS